MGELTQNNTKCMIRVNGVTLIERVLDQFSKLKLNKVIMVIGYKGEELRSFVRCADKSEENSSSQALWGI